MITGDLERRIDRVVDALGSGGLTDPLEVVDQIGYLLFLRRLDVRQALAESRSRERGGLLDAVIFLPGQRHLRWGAFARLEPEERHDVVARQVFPFLRSFGGDGSTYAEHVRGARFRVPTPDLLDQVVDLVDAFPLDDRESSGDAFDHLLAAALGSVGSTPRQVARLMVELVAPRPDDEIGDPRCGTGGLLVAATAYLRDHHPTALTDSAQQRHVAGSMFHGADTDPRMLRVAGMHLLMHGIESPDVRADALAGPCTVLLADLASAPDALSSLLPLLAPGGRAAVAVPDTVLSDAAHHDVRRRLVDDHRLDAVVRLPYAALVLFTRVDPDDEEVWCFDADAADVPEVLARWPMRAGSERGRDRLDRSFTVSRAEIAGHGYDLALHRYE